MATDYDAPRKSDEDQSEESIEELKARRHDKNSGKVDEDEAEAAESFERPGADLSHEELAVEVKPKQEDEFTCMSCFLVHDRSQLADAKKLISLNCADRHLSTLTRQKVSAGSASFLRGSCRADVLGLVAGPQARRQVAGGAVVVVRRAPLSQHPGQGDHRTGEAGPEHGLGEADVGVGGILG